MRRAHDTTHRNAAGQLVDANGQLMGDDHRPDAITLLLDMDGVLADFDGHFWEQCTAAGYEFDVETRDHQRHRFFTEHMPNAEERKAARALVDGPGWFEALPLMPGAADGVAYLLEQDDLDVWVCTKPLEKNPTCRDEKGAWLRTHLPALEYRLVITPDKALVRGDFLLDDAPHIGQADRAAWQPILYTAPYNGSSSEYGGLGWPRFDWHQGADALADYMRWTRDRAA